MSSIVLFLCFLLLKILPISLVKTLLIDSDFVAAAEVPVDDMHQVARNIATRSAASKEKLIAKSSSVTLI